MENLSIFRKNFFDRRILRFSSQYFSCHAIGIWQLTIDHRFQTENLSIFRENLFGPRIFPLNELYFLRDLSSIIKKRIYHFLKKTFSIHGSKRVIFFTRSIIDHHGELEEFINFQKKLFRSTNSSLFLSIFPMQIAMQFEFDGWSITDSKRRIYKFVNFQFD